MAFHQYFVRVRQGGRRTDFAENFLVSCTSCGWSHPYYVGEQEGFALYGSHLHMARLEAAKRAWEIRCKFTGEAVESFLERLLEGTSTGS